MALRVVTKVALWAPDAGHHKYARDIREDKPKRVDERQIGFAETVCSWDSGISLMICGGLKARLRRVRDDGSLSIKS